MVSKEKLCEGRKKRKNSFLFFIFIYVKGIGLYELLNCSIRGRVKKVGMGSFRLCDWFFYIIIK